MKSLRAPEAAGDRDEEAVLDVFCTPQGDALCVYLGGWAPPFLRSCFGAEGEVFPAELDFDDLDMYMKKRDAPYEKRVSHRGDIQLVARGYAATILAYWLAATFESGFRMRAQHRTEPQRHRS